MKKNVGGIDRTVRIAAGLVIIGVGVYFRSWWGLLGVVVLGTGLIGWCGFYTLIGVNTCPVKGLDRNDAGQNG